MNGINIVIQSSGLYGLWYSVDLRERLTSTQSYSTAGIQTR